MSADGMQVTQGAMIGIDEFMADLDRIISPEIPVNPDQLLVEVVERCIESRGSIFGLVLNEDKTKEKKPISFDFMAGGDESLEELIIVYMSYHEVA